MNYRIISSLFTAVTSCICLLVAFSGEASAQTEGYWRFESGAFLDDSSSNGRNLTNVDNLASQVAIPANFPITVPPTGSGLTNAMTSDLPGIGLLSAADDDAFTSGAFTVEALFRPETLGSPGSTNLLVGQWNSASGNPLDRGWFMGTNSGGIKFLIEGHDGGGLVSPLGTDKFLGQVVAGNEYYTAVSFSVDAGGANPVVTTYLQDLTNAGPLQRSIQTFGSPHVWDIPNNSTAPLSIGSTATETASFDGLIDEVRYSNGALAVENLLAYFPGITIEDEVVLNPGVSISMTLADGSVDGTIASVTVSMMDPSSSTTYAPTDMVGATLSQFGGRPGGDAEFILSPGTAAAPDSVDRAGILGDNLADTGFINMDNWAVTFDQDIVNRPGPDILLVDWGSPDTIDITIGGTTLDNMTPTSEGVAGAQSDRTRFVSDQPTVDTLALLVDPSTTFSANGITGAPGVNVYGIDLSDLGFGEGASLMSGTEVLFSDGIGIDPMEIFGLLEPTGLAGDFDDDGDVDGADFLAWQRGESLTPNSPGDLAVWEANYGMVLGGASALAAAVPEPSSMLLMIVAAGVAVFRRRSTV